MKDERVQQYKVDAVASLTVGFEHHRDFLFVDYCGLTVAQMSELRGVLRNVGAEFHVVKNSFARIAFSRMNHGDVAPYFTGPTAIAYCGEGVGSAAKILLKLSRQMPLEIKGGLVGGGVCDAVSIEALSKLPSRLELVQMLMGVMMAPLNNMAYVLDGVAIKLVRVLDAVREKKIQEN